MKNKEVIKNRSSLAEKVKDSLKYHVVDSTALLAESTPAFAAYETFIVGMSSEISMNTRLIVAGSTYAGLGYLYGKGRDISRKMFNVTDKTSERFQQLHDVLYTGAFNLAVSPAFYLTAGETDAKKIAIGTACAIGLGAINGGPMGYAVDTFRDLTGLRKSERLSKLVGRQNSKVKKGLAALLVGGAIALTAVVYSTKPDRQNIQYRTPTTQQVQTQNSH